MKINTPFIKIWNPICNRYQWVRIVTCFGYSDTGKIYKDDSRAYIVCMTENSQCQCMENKYLVVTESQIFRYNPVHFPNNWKNKIPIFPKPELGDKNVYTNKYSDINMLELYETIKKNYPKYFKVLAPKECKKELK